MKRLPKFLKSYFWEVDFNKVSIKTSKNFILKRILDRGDTKALMWLKKHFTKQDIKTLLCNTRDLSQKTANFWANYLGINPKKVPCLQKPYSRIQFGLSS